MRVYRTMYLLVYSLYRRVRLTFFVFHFQLHYSWSFSENYSVFHPSTRRCEMFFFLSFLLCTTTVSPCAFFNFHSFSPTRSLSLSASFFFAPGHFRTKTAAGVVHQILPCFALAFGFSFFFRLKRVNSLLFFFHFFACFFFFRFRFSLFFTLHFFILSLFNVLFFILRVFTFSLFAFLYIHTFQFSTYCAFRSLFMVSAVSFAFAFVTFSNFVFSH